MDLYTRESGKVGCIMYIYDGPRERRGGRESYPWRQRPPSSTTGSVTGAATCLSLILFLPSPRAPTPFLFDPLVKGLVRPESHALSSR